MFEHHKVRIWLDGSEGFPEVCCHCGMYTDQKVKLKRSVYVTREVPAGPSLIVLLLGLFITPVGWFLTIFGSDDKTETKTVKETGRIRIPLCRLCAHDAPSLVEQYCPDANEFLVAAHREFVKRIDPETLGDRPPGEARE